MATITSILSTDTVSSSRGVINTNFQNLNSSKLEQATIGQIFSSVATNVAVTPSVLGEIYKYVVKPMNTTINNSVLTADPHLKVNVNVNESWEMEGNLYMLAGNSVPDFKITYAVPTGTLWRAADNFGSNWGNDVTSTPTVTYGLSSVNGTMVRHFVQFQTNSVAGSIVAVWAQNTNVESSITALMNNSYLKFTRLN